MGCAATPRLIGNAPVRSTKIAVSTHRAEQGSPMSSQIPFVEYLRLGDAPHLVAHECTSCGARYLDRRNACAACFATSFTDVDVPT
jgi:uncharacterized OB-fold protein